MESVVTYKAKRPVYMYELGIDEPDEPREYSCAECGFFGTGFHCCECGATHEYHCVC
ncbi:hypothetical protein ACIHCQ_39810 [Streptomyces sp. NPDC052236]|uniref:hypothetical protein n=1 Tax=Streptomyces sp. NPDC052236 TaxID=3365686 RepID=UPI0037D2E265